MNVQNHQQNVLKLHCIGDLEKASFFLTFTSMIVAVRDVHKPYTRSKRRGNHICILPIRRYILKCHGNK